MTVRLPSALTLADLPLRADLRGRQPYGAPQLDAPVRLNVNENPYPPSAALVAAVAESVATATRTLNRYPDRDAVALRTELAGYLDPTGGYGFGAANIWAANGSNEVMLHLMQAFGGPGRLALGFSPTYSMYPDYCRDTFTGYVTVPRDAQFQVVVEQAIVAIEEHRPAVVLLASPNNPTGTALSLDAIAEIARTASGLVVVDEAYAEFRRPGTPTALELLAEFPRLVVTRTMSKAFALAGARVGYLAAHPALVEAVQLVRLPYHLSAVTQAVARTALRFSAELLATVDDLRRERDLLVQWLRDRGFRVAESDANFVFFGEFADRDAVFHALLERGVLIRVTGPEGWLRVSAGTPQEMAAFRAALEEVT